jgi:putative aldouronate transport system substrate-binding protein
LFGGKEMKKNHYKVIALALSIATVMGMAVGCGKTSTSSVTSSSENSNITEKDGFFYSKTPVTFTMLFSDNSAYPYKDSWTFVKTLQEKTNVKLDLTVVAMSDYANKRSVLIASGQEPEILPKSYPGTEDQFVTSGQILPISDYINQMPNYTQEINDWKLSDDLKTITQSDGKYYLLPELHQSFIADYSICMRTDILKKNNISNPESWDDFESVLKKLKELYPNITPFSDRWQLGATMQLAGPAFVKASTGLKGSEADWSGSLLRYDSEKDTFDFYPTTDEYKDELTYFNRLINEGLLDKESATQTSDQAINKFVTGKSFAISCNSQQLSTYRTKLTANLGEGNYEVKKMNVFSGPAGAYIAGNRLENGIMITQKAKDDDNFSTLLGFVDWLYYSYKGQEFCKWGVEGDTFTKSGDTYTLKDGYTLPDYGLNPDAKNAKDLRKDMGFGSGVFVLSYGGPDALAQSYMSDEDKAFSENVNKTRTLLPNAPKVTPEDEDVQESQNMLNSTLKDYMNSMSYKFILGQTSISTGWDDYVKEFENKGSTKYTDTNNSEYAKQKK